MLTKFWLKKTLVCYVFFAYYFFGWSSIVQELLSAGSYNQPKSVHDIIALLTARLSRWDDR